MEKNSLSTAYQLDVAILLWTNRKNIRLHNYNYSKTKAELRKIH